jgi:outer membrane receptor protein involved in Fe transport
MVGDQLLHLGFHRLALRYRGRWPRVQLAAGFEIGPDYTRSTGDPERNYDDQIHITELVMRPHVTATVPVVPSLKLRFGSDVLIQSWRVDIGFVDVPGELADNLFPRWAFTTGAFVQVDWEPTRRLLIRPGVRFDHYAYLMTGGTVRQTSVDPRLSARFEVRPWLHVKGGFGLYQSPPRFMVPWPGLEGIGLSQGLNRSYQASFGGEVVLPWNATLDGQLYYNWMPNLSEYPIGDESARPAAHDSGQATYRGRSYGFELIARRRLGQRLFGWVTYALARSERDYPVAGWRPADFDQTHLVNLVASYALGRAWTVSTVFHYNSGRPYTPGVAEDELQLADRNRGRLPDYWRADLRIEKREAFDTWYLDFYVDWLNVSLRREAVSWNYNRMAPETILLTLPTFGLQVVF